jgi:hypothetical protein
VTEVAADPIDATTTLRPVDTATTREGVHSDQDADELRGAMVDAIVDEVIVEPEWLGLVPSREVEAALRTVPRADRAAALVALGDDGGRWRRGSGFWRSAVAGTTPRCFGSWSGRAAR